MTVDYEVTRSSLTLSSELSLYPLSLPLYRFLPWELGVPVEMPQRNRSQQADQGEDHLTNRPMRSSGYGSSDNPLELAPTSRHIHSRSVSSQLFSTALGTFKGLFLTFPPRCSVSSLIRHMKTCQLQPNEASIDFFPGTQPHLQVLLLVTVLNLVINIGDYQFLSSVRRSHILFQDSLALDKADIESHTLRRNSSTHSSWYFQTDTMRLVWRVATPRRIGCSG